MEVVFTDRAIRRLMSALYFLWDQLGEDKILEIRNNIVKRALKLADYPESGQTEEYLLHLEQGHIRIIEGHFKIIYLIKGDTIYITDIFDSRQDPREML